MNCLRKTYLCVAVAMLLFSPMPEARSQDTNYDEAKVPKYTLPDPLVLADGQKVADAETWVRRRRPEILRLFQTHVYGRSPAAPENITFKVTSRDDRALNGLAVRKEVGVYFAGRDDGPRMNILIYLPAKAKTPSLKACTVRLERLGADG